MAEEKFNGIPHPSPVREEASGPVAGDGSDNEARASAAARSAGGGRSGAERVSDGAPHPDGGAEGTSEPLAASAGSAPELPARSGFPTLADLLVFLGIFLVSNLVGMLIAMAAGCTWPDMVAAMTGDEAAQQAAQLGMARFNAVSYSVAMVLSLAGFLFYRARRGGPRTLGRYAARGLNPMLLLWGVVCLFAMSVVLEPLMRLLPEVPPVYGRGAWAILTLVVLAPLFEELLFRGVLLESLRLRYGVVAALLLSSLLFGVVHLYPTVAVNAFFSGMILGFIYIVSESLWSSIFLHAVNNAIAYVLLAAGLGSGMLGDWIGNRTLYYVLYAVAAVVLIVSLLMVVRTLRRIGEEAKNRVAA